MSSHTPTHTLACAPSAIWGPAQGGVPGRGERVRPLLEAAGGAAGGGDVIPLGE